MERLSTVIFQFFGDHLLTWDQESIERWIDETEVPGLGNDELRAKFAVAERDFVLGICSRWYNKHLSTRSFKDSYHVYDEIEQSLLETSNESFESLIWLSIALSLKTLVLALITNDADLAAKLSGRSRKYISDIVFLSHDSIVEEEFDWIIRLRRFLVAFDEVLSNLHDQSKLVGSLLSSAENLGPNPSTKAKALDLQRLTDSIIWAVEERESGVVFQTFWKLIFLRWSFRATRIYSDQVEDVVISKMRKNDSEYEDYWNELDSVRDYMKKTCEAMNDHIPSFEDLVNIMLEENKQGNRKSIFCGDWTKPFNEVKSRRIEVCEAISIDNDLDDAISLQQQIVDVDFPNLMSARGKPWSDVAWIAAEQFERCYLMLLSKLKSIEWNQNIDEEEEISEIREIIFGVLHLSLLQTREKLWLAAWRDLLMIKVAVDYLSRIPRLQASDSRDFSQLKPVTKWARKELSLFSRYTQAFHGSNTPTQLQNCLNVARGMHTENALVKMSKKQISLRAAFGQLMKALYFSILGSISSYNQSQDIILSQPSEIDYKFEDNYIDPVKIAELASQEYKLTSELFATAQGAKPIYLKVWSDWADIRSMNQSAWGIYKIAFRRANETEIALDEKERRRLFALASEKYEAASSAFKEVAAQSRSVDTRYVHIERSRALRCEALSRLMKIPVCRNPTQAIMISKSARDFYLAAADEAIMAENISDFSSLMGISAACQVLPHIWMADSLVKKQDRKAALVEYTSAAKYASDACEYMMDGLFGELNPLLGFFIMYATASQAQLEFNLKKRTFVELVETLQESVDTIEKSSLAHRDVAYSDVWPDSYIFSMLLGQKNHLSAVLYDARTRFGRKGRNFAQAAFWHDKAAEASKLAKTSFLPHYPKAAKRCHDDSVYHEVMKHLFVAAEYVVQVGRSRFPDEFIRTLDKSWDELKYAEYLLEHFLAPDESSTIAMMRPELVKAASTLRKTIRNLRSRYSSRESLSPKLLHSVLGGAQVPLGDRIYSCGGSSLEEVVTYMAMLNISERGFMGHPYLYPVVEFQETIGETFPVAHIQIQNHGKGIAKDVRIHASLLHPKSLTKGITFLWSPPNQFDSISHEQKHITLRIRANPDTMKKIVNMSIKISIDYKNIYGEKGNTTILKQIPLHRNDEHLSLLESSSGTRKTRSRIRRLIDGVRDKFLSK
ncbi:MAG: hypothetical protein EAX81_07840 [Candidatus Thorarchaeota archaeon]|nr:hypothetical protein [Candidatus Thorarchaeota archaeon]